MIKTVIELYSSKLPSVKWQPFGLGQFLGVIKPAPVLIIPATTTNIILR
jgi:hypothetical protein